MEHYAFIHGSSEGQSTIIPPGCPSTICSALANKYFQGRVPRQKQSAAQISLFIDLFRSATNDIFCAYSFVNNDCLGSKGRDGQYLAITVLCKGYFAYPEAIYAMLQSAYNQMFATGKILSKTQEGKDQYVIAQFSEREDYLIALLEKINNAFSNISSGQVRSLSMPIAEADYDSWEGVKVNLSNSNSLSTFNDLCKYGRVYVSTEYESPFQIIKKLEERIHSLESEKSELEKRIASAKHAEKSKAKEEIDSLNAQLKQSDDTISCLRMENEKYHASMDIVRGELEKYAKASKPMTNVREQKEHYKDNSKKDLRKNLLLWLILLLTIICSILQFCFFRNSSSLIEEKAGEIMEVISAKQNEHPAKKGETTEAKKSISIVYPQSIEAPAKGGNYNITVTSDSEWEAPESKAKWVSINKIDYKCLSVKISENKNNQSREYTFMLLGDKQIKITQEANVSQKADYGIVLKDSNGSTLTDGAVVYNEQVIKGTVTNLIIASNGYGWTYSGCSGDRNNVKDVTITIKGEAGSIAYIGYGNKNNRDERQIISLKIIAPPSYSETETGSTDD